MAYTKTVWNNRQAPAINAENLNHIEQGIYDAHQITTEAIGPAVAEWLDEHPEATTTVEDGSITGEKLADSLKDEIYGKVSADLMNGHGYVSHATQQNILDCIYSYVENYDKMVYGVGNTSPYLDNPAIDPDGRFRVSCSVLGMLVLYGVRFETSVMRYPAKTTAAEMMSAVGTYLYKGSESGYVNGNWYHYNGNSLTDIGKATNDQYYSFGIHLDEEDAIEYTDGYRFYAHTLAPYLYSKGELFKRDDDFSNLQCGDVIFLSYMDESSENWERIGHIMFFLCKNQRGDVICAEASSTTTDTAYNYGETAPIFISRYPLNNSRLQTAIWCYRPPYNSDENYIIPQNILNSFGSKGTSVSGDTSLYATVTLNKELKPYKVYSFAINITFTNDSGINDVRIRIGGDTTKPSVIPSTALPPIKNDDGSYTFYFMDYLNSVRAGYASDTLRFINYEAAGDRDVNIGQNVTVNWVCGTEGIWKLLSELPYEKELMSQIAALNNYVSFIAFTSANITTQVNSLGRGKYSGYLSSSNAGASSIPTSSSYYVDAYVNSTNYAIIRVLSVDGSHEYIKPKQSGSWASSWITVR